MPDPASITPVALATNDDIEWLELFIEMEAASDERFTFAADDIDALRRIAKSAALASQAAAPAVPVERVLALAKALCAAVGVYDSDSNGEPQIVAFFRSAKDRNTALSLWTECAAALEALAKGGDDASAG